MNYGSIAAPPAYRSGLDARWKGTMEGILSSITVRPQQAIADALDELGLSLDTTGLHPRLVGGRLILSLDAPRTPLEARGVADAVITTSDLTLVASDDFAERKKSVDNPFPS